MTLRTMNTDMKMSPSVDGQGLLRRLKATVCRTALCAALAGAGALALGAAPAKAEVPIATFVGFSDYRSASLSPDGRKVVAIKREAVGDILILIDIDSGEVKPLSVARSDQNMRVDFVYFKGNSRVIFGLSQRVRIVHGNSNADRTGNVDDGVARYRMIYSSNTDGTGLVSLYDPTRDQGFDKSVSAGIIDDLPSDPRHVLLIVPKEGGAALWRVNVETATREEIERGDINTINWETDVNGVPVMRQDIMEGGRGFVWKRRPPGAKDWIEIIRYKGAEGANSAPTFTPVSPGVKPNEMIVLARRDGADKSAAYTYNTTTGQFGEEIASSPDFDVQRVVVDRERRTVLGACWIEYRLACDPRDEAFGRIWNGLGKALGPDVNVSILSRSEGGTDRWLVRTFGPKDLGTYYIFDNGKKTLSILFQDHQDIAPELLPSSKVFNYTTSDGKAQWGYLWLPPGVSDTDRNLPLVVIPHGGPEGRDVFGYDPFAQTFATRGYAVLQPNFRGGAGSGRAFVEAGHRQWGQRMQEDVADATRSLIKTGAIDPSRVCIMGWSYGGYTAMTAAFKNTDLFKCSVAGAGVSDLPEMLRWVRDGSTGKDVFGRGGVGPTSVTYKYWLTAIGDPEKDRPILSANSAARNADKVSIPLLLIHGDEDLTVPYDQSVIMQKALAKVGKTAKLVTIEDAGHSPDPDQADRWATALGEAVTFVASHIGPGVGASRP